MSPSLILALLLYHPSTSRASDSDTTDELLHAALDHARDMKYCARGDTVVAMHRIGNASVIKLVDIK